ncbi:MAG: hypothetical protein VB118_06265 [Oscillospiraceae bacterium]|nr:hypothetical protein [Oscillospiraceae bacterium]
MISNNDLKSAAKKSGLDKEEVLTSIKEHLTESSPASAHKKSRRINFGRYTGIIAAALAVVILLPLTAYAVIPEFRNYINLNFLYQPVTTEIPEGYTAIYTLDDLETVRQNLSGSYIMMNDINIPDSEYAPGGRYENGFLPIGNSEKIDEGFKGIFDGNGHTIFNLKIDGSSCRNAGLFASASTSSMMEKTTEPNENGEDMETYNKDTLVFPIIKRLKIDGAELTISSETYYAGIISGISFIIAGCEVKNSVINIMSSYSYYIGGITGKAFLIDSCISDVSFEFKGTSETIHSKVGGLCGFSYAALTSYYKGSGCHGNIDNVSFLGLYDEANNKIPAVIEAGVFESICNKIKEKSGDFMCAKFRAFFIWPESQGKGSSLFIDAFKTCSLDDNTGYYHLLTDIMTNESEWLSKTISEALTKEEYEEVLSTNKFKINIMNCYIVSPDETPNAEYFSGFDYENIWYTGDDGLPKLRIFDKTDNN